MSATPKRPDCWGFAMQFLGEPGSAEVEQYVAALEAEIERLQDTLKLQQASYEREIALDVASAFEEAANLAESWADYGVSVSSIGPRIAASIRAVAASQAEKRGP